MSKPPRKIDAARQWQKLERLAERADVAEVKAAILGYVAHAEHQSAQQLLDADGKIDAAEALFEQASFKASPMDTWLSDLVGDQFERAFQARKAALKDAYAVQDRLLRPLHAEPLPFDLSSPLVANDRAMQHIRRHMDEHAPNTKRQAKLEDCLQALAGIEQQPLDGVHLGEILVRKLKKAPTARTIVLQ